MHNMIIAIDGTAASGKGSLAKNLSKFLKDEEVNQSMDKILRNLSSKLSAKLRK